MTKRRRSFGKKRTQSRKQIFVGRKEQLQRFERNLERGPDSDDFLNIFNVFGQGGVGKTYLVTRYREIADQAVPGTKRNHLPIIHRSHPFDFRTPAGLFILVS